MKVYHHQQAKPLSTTSRPHLAQPTPHDQLQMTTAVKPIPTAMIPYLAKRQPEVSQLTTAAAAPCQPVAQQQLELTIQTTSPNMIRPQEDMTTSQQSTMTTMTRISKTTLAKERRNSSSSSNNNQETQLLAIQIQTQQITPLVSNSRQQQTWTPAEMLASTEPTTTAAMRDTIPNNMMPVPMIRPTTSPSTAEIRVNMMPADRVTMPQPMTTMPPTMTPLHISTIPQVDREQILPATAPQQPHRQQYNRRKSRHQQYQHQSHQAPLHPLQQQLLQQHRLQQQEEAAAAQQKAVHNRERAVALWGHQVQLEASPAENPICHNSLPRQQPKSSRDPELDLTTSQLASDCIDPFDLEFSISSPSLMRSFDSDTEVEEATNNSISEMTLSPTLTTIRMIAIDQGE